jgi:hypothetical protein
MVSSLLHAVLLHASCILDQAYSSDNLVVQWGHQDNYEIVRKVGRGKYSEVSFRRHTNCGASAKLT